MAEQSKHEKRQAKIENLLNMAQEGIKDVFESEKYKNYLKVMSKFHHYSFRNNLLIASQKPDATYVAGYQAWRTKFKRQVQRGEKGIEILGYTPYHRTETVQVKDKNGNPVFDVNGEIKTEKRKVLIPAFSPVNVFDVSQTKGEPLPQLINELDGSVEAYNDLFNAIGSVSRYKVEFEDIKGGAKGYCDYLNKKIAINNGMSEVQNIKTLIHEITHADLHVPEIEQSNKKDSRTREIEAESTAFEMCIRDSSITLEKFNSIPTTEQNILMLIILRTLIAPYLAYEYKTTKILLSIKEEEFEASGKEVVKEGFKILEKHLKDILNIKDNTKAEIILPEISKTDIFTVKDMKAEEKLTSPPRLYTEDTLLLAMETAGKIIEDEELKEAIKDSGLGTPATRANIIENIISKGYIERKGKSLIATSKAKSFISLVDDRIKEPELTAEWEKQLLDMEKGLVDEIEFTNNIKTFVKNIVEEAPKNTIKNPVFYKKEIVGICPVCKKDIIENKKAFTCEDRACKFVIWKTIAGKNITKTQAKKLITKGKTDLIKGFKSKKGTTFNAYIVLKPDNTTAFEFN